MNNNWEFDYSELYNNNNPGRNAQNTAAPEAESPLQGAPPTPIPGIPAGPGAPCKGDSASGAVVFCAFLPGLLLL